MAIQRMYSGKGGAVEFDKPAITPTEISQQYGRSMTDILKYKQTMAQRRKEGILKLTDVGVTEGLMGESQARQAKRMEAFREKSVDVLMGEKDPSDPSTSAMMEIQAEKNRTAQAGEKELKVQGEFIKAQTLMAADAASEQPKFDQEFYTKAVEYYRTHEGAYPPGGFIKAIGFGLDQLYWEAVDEIGTEEGIAKPGEVGEWETLGRERVYKETEIMSQASSLWGSPTVQKKLKEEKGINSLEELVEQMRKDLPKLTPKITHARRMKEEPELGAVRAVPGASTSADIKVMPGGEETKQMMGTEGKVKNYDVTFVNEIQGFKGEVTLSPGGILKTTDVEMADIKAGETLGEKRYRKGDEIKGENLVGYSFKTVQAPSVVGYKVLTGEDITIYKKNWLGNDVKDYVIKAGSQVDRKQFDDMSKEQQAMVTTKPFVDIVVHSAAYKNFTISEPLTKAWKRKLSLSDEAYNNYQKGYSAEGAPEGEGESTASGHKEFY